DLDVHSTSHNQNGRIIEDIIFLLKDLRNAVAHNGVIFDCRFRNSNPPSRLTQFIQSETSINNISFDNIIDYLIIHIYLLKKLGIQKTNLKGLVRHLNLKSKQFRKDINVLIPTSILGFVFGSKI